MRQSARSAIEAVIAGLPRSERLAADLTWKAIIESLKRGETELKIGDEDLRQNRWLRNYAPRFVQKGLRAIQSLGLIDRRRRRGVRTITLLPLLDGARRAF
jgi:hypothetical protein